MRIDENKQSVYFRTIVDASNKEKNEMHRSYHNDWVTRDKGFQRHIKDSDGKIIPGTERYSKSKLQSTRGVFIKKRVNNTFVDEQKFIKKEALTSKDAILKTVDFNKNQKLYLTVGIKNIDFSGKEAEIYQLDLSSSCFYVMLVTKINEK